MKKKVFVILISILVLFSACGKTVKKSDGKFKIGIVQIVEHEALDRARLGFIEGLDEANIKVDIDYKNAQGEIATCRSIVEKFIKDEVDLIYAISTPAAQVAAAATDKIPVLFSAVTDAEQAGLVESNEKPGSNVSGSSDMVDINKQLSIFKEINENIKKIGIIYSQDEQNSHSQAKLIKEKAKTLGLEIIEKQIQNISDLPQVSESLMKNIEGLYILSDNKIASSVSLLTQMANINNVISVCAEEAHVREGGLISQGINYKSLGAQTAEMAKKILIDKLSPSDLPVELSEKVERVINIDSLKLLKLNPDLKVFQDSKNISE